MQDTAELSIGDLERMAEQHEQLAQRYRAEVTRRMEARRACQHTNSERSLRVPALVCRDCGALWQ